MKSARRRPMVLLLAAAWVAVVAAVAGVTWWAIDAAGRDVLTAGDPAPLSAAGTTPGADGALGIPLPTGGPAKPRDDQPSPGAASGAQRPQSTPTDDTPTNRQVRSWQGSAGAVTAVCSGFAVSLQSVTPHDGWQVDIEERGPDEVVVEFDTRLDGLDDDDYEIEVEAECVDGVPRFEIDVDD